MKLLIPGGAGYIGSHMVKFAQEQGNDVVVLDNFSTGHTWSIKDCEIINVDLLDKEKLSKAFKGRYFDGVIHFAAKSIVSESIIKPNLYYENNFVGTLNLVNEMLRHDINNLVFSSTAAIFGNPATNKISENHPQVPINPYGKSKLMVETMLQDFCSAYGFNASCLRYFNAAGADESGDIGEMHDPETHLIPNILKSAHNGDNALNIYGNDYHTSDGTCIRDYVHVTDLAEAHLLALKKLKKERGFMAINLGSGNGFSVLDVINCCKKITKLNIRYNACERREGDPAVLVADNMYAKKLLNWSPKRELDQIIDSAWAWHKASLKLSIDND